ncbi:MAG: ABC transporter permease [Firmicutes bacterium]|nr:ABC transporter permease [Bacillota bacterium]
MNPHQDYAATPWAMLTSFWRNRQLLWQMTRRDVTSRYRGSIFGLAWSFFTPLLMLAVYTFVFSVVFKARWGTGGSESRADFAIILFVGVLVHALFAECLNRSPSLILSNVNYVKKVIFPLEILPWMVLGSALFNCFLSTAVLLMLQLLINHICPWTVVFFPLVLLPIVFTGMGCAWFLASMGVYVRDVGQVTGIITMVLMFLSPIFYPITALPPVYQTWLHLNPLTSIIGESRDVLVFGALPNWPHLGIALLAGLLVAWAGFWWFQRTRKGFADVL